MLRWSNQGIFSEKAEGNRDYSDVFIMISYETREIDDIQAKPSLPGYARNKLLKVQNRSDDRLGTYFSIF